MSTVVDAPASDERNEDDARHSVLDAFGWALARAGYGVGGSKTASKVH